MLFPADVEARLGFLKLRELFLGFILSDLGRGKLADLSYSTDGQWIRNQYRQVEEYMKLAADGRIPSPYYYDPQSFYLLLQVAGAYLEAEPLRHIAQSMVSVWELKNALQQAGDSAPDLSRLSSNLVPSVTPFKSILSLVDESFNLIDKASPSLREIRKRIREREIRVRKIMDELFRRAAAEGYVPEGASISLRDGRMTVPLLAEHKRRLKGYVVDESATGHTVYVEPVEALEAENELRNLRHEERLEAIRILRELTSRIHEEFANVQAACRFLGEWDLLQAKGKFHSLYDCCTPRLSPNGVKNWVRARNPVLQLALGRDREVVPLDIWLSNEDSMLLVSGPNAGGKSVCLKTVGLIQYMFQCGLPVPVDERSIMMVFDDLLLDIGDQQSMESDLSTYSSHLKNMKLFLEQAGPRSLLLVDELGAGTDPNFGGGIAEAVLQGLVNKGAWGIVTTHYHNLKMFAGRTPGIQNASMTFDSKRLEPLFILEIGKPGSSYAIEIATRMGLPEEVRNSAEKIVGRELIGLEALLKKVEEDKVRLQRESQSVAVKQQQLDNDLARYKKLSDELSSRRKEIIGTAREEASELVLKANREIEKTIRHIRESKAEKKETRKVRKSLGELTEKISALQEKPRPVYLRQADLSVGSTVRIHGQESSGRIVSLGKKNAHVDFAGIRTQVALSKLEPAPAQTPQEQRASSGIATFKLGRPIESILDLRGKRAEEAKQLLERFLDDATLAGLGEVRVLHGKGEGILRKVIREQLTGHRGVSRYTDEHVERGGDGITVVTLE